MKKLVLVFLLVFASFAVAQAPQQGGVPVGDITQLNNILAQLQQTAIDANLALSRMRIDKWKTDGSVKKQAEGNSESLQRNLGGALPEMIGKVRAAPANLAANFRLYRNLNVVYDVFASVTESAGAFGPKEQYEPLATQAASIDSLRRQLADRIDQLAIAKELELSQLRNLAAQARQQVVSAPPKKIIVDDTEPAKPKKKKAKPVAPPK